MRTLGIIPSRWGSTRFPGKPLAIINGKPMIQHVYERVSRIPQLSGAIVATDDDRIMDCVREFGGQAVMTSSTHKSGTDRCGEVLKNLIAKNIRPDVVINIQGDEPFIRPETITAVANLLKNNPLCDIATAVTATTDDAKIDNPNCVKAVLAKDGRALYFSRSRVPFKRELTEENKNIPYWHHCGIYGYRRAALERFVHLPVSPLEKLEKLEQLRALEDGMKIYCVEIQPGGPAIDTVEDLARAEAYFKQQMQ